MDSVRVRRLALGDLRIGLSPGLSPEYGAFLAQAGAVCFDTHGHVWGVQMTVDGAFNEAFAVDWPVVDDAQRLSWKDFDEAVEYGAYGIALLVLRDLEGFTVLEKAIKGGGFDYWVGTHDALPFQRKSRLEVSGILKGDDSDIRSRVRTKVAQTELSDGYCPAHVVVVEFSRPLSRVVKK